VYEVYLQLVNSRQDITAEALKEGINGVKKSGREASTSVQDLCKWAGVSKSSFHYQAALST
jgi:hypothetical protein